MSTVASTDLILVERDNVLYKETFANRANIEDDDLILVERGTTIHKCPFLNWIGGVFQDPMQINSTVVSFPDIVPLYTSVNDAIDAYRVLSSQVNVNGTTAGLSRTGYLYIGFRNNAATSFYGDFCIGSLQILSNDTTFRSTSYDWNFNRTDSLGIGGWYTTHGQITTGGNTPSAPNGYTYYAITSSQSVRSWSRANYTSSSSTGAADGIYNSSTYSGGGGTVLAETARPPQQTSTYYMYAETSGSSKWDVFWFRTVNTVTIYNGDYIRLAYGGGNGPNSGSGLPAAENVWCYMS